MALRVLLLAGLAPAATAMPVTPAERAAAFATCAGTYAAEVEHMALFDGARAEALEDRRAGFAALLAAIRPPAALQPPAAGAAPAAAEATRLRAVRVQARLAHRALLGDATFHPDAARRARAERAASRRRAACDRLLLGA